MLAVIGLFSSTIQSRAAEDQKGLTYYMDVHGAAVLVRCLHAMSELNPKYREPRDAAMNWMLRQMRDFRSAGRTWLQNPSAPAGRKSFHATVTPSANFNARTLLEIYRETKDPRLLVAVKAHINWLKTTAVMRKKDAGPAHARSGRIMVFNQQGKFLDEWSGLLMPCGLSGTDRDELWVCGSLPHWWKRPEKHPEYKDQLFMRFSTKGRVQQLWIIPLGDIGENKDKSDMARLKPGEAVVVHYIAQDSKGNIYVGDIYGERAQKFVTIRNRGK